MIVLDMEQGSPEWYDVRGKLPTASNFSKILTPATRKPSSQAVGYMNELLANWLSGGTADPGEGFQSDWMTRGIELEEEAISWFEMKTNVDVHRPGFCMRDDHLAGCSPDGLLADYEHGLEVKCPKGSTHIGYLLHKQLPREYFSQVQGSMWVTGYHSWSFLSYHPSLEPFLITVERDEKYMADLQLAIVGFNNEMQQKRDMLLASGYSVPAPRIDHHAA